MQLTREQLNYVVDQIAARLKSEKIAYTVAEAITATGASESAIRDAISSGRLKAKKRGRQYLISREALKKWVGVAWHPFTEIARTPKHSVRRL